MPERQTVTVNRATDGSLNRDEIEVSIDRVVAGTYFIYREDNGRELGRVEKRGTLWQAYANPAAFRGTGPDDRGDMLDKVPAPLHNGKGPVAYDRLRYGAVCDLVQYLYRKHAPAVREGRCPGVEAHTVPATGEDRRCRR